VPVSPGRLAATDQTKEFDMGAFASSAALTALQVGLEVAQKKAAQKDAREAQKADAVAQATQIRQAHAIDQRERRERLRRALATQRARFGAQGVSAQSGSSAAVLSGLASSADARDRGLRQLTQLRLQRLDDQLDARGSNDLLQTAYPIARTGISLVGRGINRTSLLDDA
jgi:hypothetical protein